MYDVQIRHDGSGGLYFVVVGPKVPRDNEFRDRESAERWVDRRVVQDRRNVRSRSAARGRAEALSSVGMVRSRYGWE